MKLFKDPKSEKRFITVSAVLTAFILTFLLVIVIITQSTDKAPETDNNEDTSSVTPLTQETKTEYINGVWIATAYNIDFPSSPDLSADSLMGELDEIVATARTAGLNAIFFQVRPCADALYKSEIYPVSKALSSTGELPLDCLEYIIEKAHSEGIAVHAWINPLRASLNGDVSTLPDMSPAKMHPEYCIKYADGRTYFDCGKKEVRELVAAGISEILDNYSVDGIVFDDYFYPYPQNITDDNGNSTVAVFADDSTYSACGNGKNLDDWRRENVNALVKLAYDTVKAKNENVLFGISPFGIWKNGAGDETGSKTFGLESYSSIYCDTVAWINGGYVDYVAPQIYWRDEDTAAPYGELCRWWASVTEGTGVSLIVCHGAYRYSEDWESPEGIMTSQLEMASTYPSYSGSVFYGYEEILSNTHGIKDEIEKSLIKIVD